MEHLTITTIATDRELDGIELKGDRGTIVKLTFEIVYPDKSKKIVVHDFEWINALSAIIFDANVMNDEQKSIFFVDREVWEANPAFIKVSKDGLMSGSCCKRAGHGGDDCWGMLVSNKKPFGG